MFEGEKSTTAGGDRLRKRVIAQVLELLARTEERHPDWTPPPFNPYLVAETLGIPIQESDELGPWDALLVPTGGDGFRIVSNSRIRSEGRRRFSIAHEIGHTLLPDAEKSYHLRTKAREQYYGSEEARQEERLCDLAAAEMLMPRRVFGESMATHGFRAAAVPLLAEFYGVSREAAALRMVEMRDKPSAIGFFKYGIRPSAVGKPEGSLSLAERAAAYRVQRVFRAPGFPYLFPEGKSIHYRSVIYRAAFERGEQLGVETFVLGNCKCSLEVSAVSLRRNNFNKKLPTVCAVFQSQ